MSHIAKNSSTNFSKEPLRVVHIVTAAYTTEFMQGQLAYLRSQGFEVTVVTSPDPRLADIASREGVQIRTVKMTREIQPIRDLVALIQLYFVLRKLRPHVVNASTPKAGLLGMLAGFFLRAPLRIYTLRGLRLETTWRWRRLLLITCEKIAAACAHRVVCVSPSLRDAYLKIKCTTARKALVLGNGSSNGVDAEKFSALPDVVAKARRIRQQFGIPATAQVIGFVGRFTRDKGITDAVEVFEQLQWKFPDLHMLMVGDFEQYNRVERVIRQRIENQRKIHVTGMIDVSGMAPYYHACDLLLFPSRREGFPNAVLEAQASSLPVVAYAATGTTDAIKSGETGVIVPQGERAGLIAAVGKYLSDRTLRARHGLSARARVVDAFCPQVIWKSLADLYQSEFCRHEIHFMRPGQGPTRDDQQSNAA